MVSSSRRVQLYAELRDAMRENASRTLLLHQAVADQLGLNPTDLKCLDLARHEPYLTAGRLAELTGLRTSSITAVLDRLAARGLVERRRDSADRRRVIVVATGAHLAKGAAIFGRLAANIETVLDQHTDAELAAYLVITRRLNAASREFTGTVTARDDGAAGQPDDSAASRGR